jgi:F420-non-reducing hydrogenase iron-sulfur subunit
MQADFKPRITLFHCINTFGEADVIPLTGGEAFEPKFVKLPCSSMVKDVFLMRAFESGADAVVVLVCPEGACRYVEGNLRAKKRVQYVKGLLDAIGVGGRRLALVNVSHGDVAAAEAALGEILEDLRGMGPNPAAVQMKS